MSKKIDPMEDLIPKMKSLGVSPGKAVACDVQPPGILGQAYELVTNAFGLYPVNGEVQIYHYDLTVCAQFGDGEKMKIVEFTKKSNIDAVVNERKARTVKVLKYFMRREPDFFGSPDEIFFDGQAQLFALKDFFNGKNNEKKVFTECAADIMGDFISNMNVPITLQIQRAGNHSFVYSVEGMIRGASQDLQEMDKVNQLLQFTEIVLNQKAIMDPDEYKVFESGKTFMVNPRERGFAISETPDVPDGKFVDIGLQKSVRVLEGPNGREGYALLMLADSKKAAFHKEQTIVDKVEEMVNGTKDVKTIFPKIVQVLKGVRVETMHLQTKKELRVESISTQNAKEMRLEIGSQVKTVEEYFRDKYSYHLRRPDLPLVLVRERGSMNAYPMELLRILPMQRVTVQQQTAEQAGQTTRKCAVAPSQRQRDIWRMATVLKLVPPSPTASVDNKYLSNAGIALTSSTLKMKGRQLPGPKLRYQNGSPGKYNEIMANAGLWHTTPDTTFLFPAQCRIWGVYCISGNIIRNTREADDIIKQLAKLMIRNGERKGMCLGSPSDFAVLSGAEELLEKMKVAKAAGCEFVLVCTPEKITTIHSLLKLYEVRFGMATQDLKYETAVNIVRNKKLVTLDNVLNKTNIKLGGLNYHINLSPIANGNGKDWIRPDRVFIGLSITQPPPGARFEAEKEGGSSGSSASVLGYASNILSDPHAIVGDFIFQDVVKDETMVSMETVLAKIVDQYKSHHKDAVPKEMWFYRAGVGEGSFKKILSCEIPLLRTYLRNAGLEEVKIVFMVVTKEHNLRLFKADINPAEKPTQQNIPSGVVLDHNMTHPYMKEFYLNSHITLQGTARTPKYTVLVDDIGLSMDELEGTSYGLTFNHQIVSMATSLPSPLYIAGRYAERGQKLLHAYVDQYKPLPLGALSDRLSYSGTCFADRRINA